MEEEFVTWMTVLALMMGLPLLHTLLECKRDRDAKIRIARWWIACILIVVLSFLSALLFGLAGHLLTYFIVSKPSPVSTECRILTNSVDLRSSKVCQLGLLNYKSKNVLLSTGKTRYRCQYDYYWASVFKVEYKPLASSQPIQAAAEAPKEALPVYCRPNFSSAWKTKDKFKINETYHCKYTPGKSKVDIVGDNFFNCSAQEPSIFELLNRVTILFWRSDRFLLSKQSIFVNLMWNMVAFIFAGMSCSILVTGFAKIIRVLRFKLLGRQESKKDGDEFFEARLQLFCICFASLFVVIWISGQHEEFSRLCRLLIRAYLEGSHTREWWNSFPVPKL